MYEVGDYIKVRSLQSLSNEYGLLRDGNTIKSPYGDIEIRNGDDTPFHNNLGLYECLSVQHSIRGYIYRIRFKGESFLVLDKEIVGIRGE